MIHPDTELREVSPEIGFGVFAVRRLPRGTVTWVLDDLDQRIVPERLGRLGRLYRPLLDRYAYLNQRGDRILCWDIGRYMNHSCDANSISTGWDLDIAVRDIEAGEEITNDYLLLNLDCAFECACGSPRCRGQVSSDPGEWECRAGELDEKVRAACADAGRVTQALWSFVRAKQEVRRAFRNPTLAPSVTAHRLHAKKKAPMLAGSARGA